MHWEEHTANKWTVLATFLLLWWFTMTEATSKGRVYIDKRQSWWGGVITSSRQQGAENSHPQPQAGSTENELEVGKDFYSQSPPLVIDFFQQGFASQTSPGSINNWHQVFNYWSLWEIVLIQTTIQTNRQTWDSCFSLYLPNWSYTRFYPWKVFIF